MKLETISHALYEASVPQAGKHILARQKGENIIVYQAFNPNISRYAVHFQRFGGSYYKFSRMSWIKPNFLWMMYRAGWADKEHQQQILAIEISKAHFMQVLDKAVHSTFKESIYGTHENWKAALATSEVRLQWDPDHAPNGEKLERRAIQLGLRGETLSQFATEWIVSIEDITPFVKEQKARLDAGRKDELLVIRESVLEVANPQIIEKLELDKY